MEYNTGKKKLLNGEYGRHIQKMIEYAVDIKDANLRNQQAKAIVRAMASFSQGGKETEDFWHKLWDQLFVISGYRLDADSPFPKPEPKPEEVRKKPLKYPKHKIRFRPYGLLIENIIKKITTEEDCQEKEQAIVNIANHLKKQYLNWNRDSVSDDLIFEHLDILSDEKIKMNENFRFSSTRDILSDLATTNTNNGKSSNKNKKKSNSVSTNSATSNSRNNNNNNNNIGKKKTSSNHPSNHPSKNLSKNPSNHPRKNPVNPVKNNNSGTNSHKK
jgi:hypothetical protein